MISTSVQRSERLIPALWHGARVALRRGGGQLGPTRLFRPIGAVIYTATARWLPMRTFARVVIASLCLALSACATKKFVRTEQYPLPAFPWPPPAPSARAELPRPLFEQSASQFALAGRLTTALEQAGYAEYSFYGAPGGFALVARLERIQDDGRSEPEGFRFLDPDAAEPFSLVTYISRLFFAPQGYYRQLVFVLTNHPFTADANATLESNNARRLLRSGANRLPSLYREKAVSRDHALTVLVYEFRKGPADRDVVTLEPGRLSGRVHLERSGILTALERPQPRP